MTIREPTPGKTEARRRGPEVRTGGNGEARDKVLALLDAIDLEREWFGRTMHESLCQSLQGAGFLFRVLKTRLKAAEVPLPPEMDDLEAALRRAAAEAREISLLIGEPPVSTTPPVSALADLAERISEKIPCDFLCDDFITTMDPFLAGQLIRIAREAVRASLSARDISRMTLSLSHERDEVILTLEHDGDFAATDQTLPAATLWHLPGIRAGAIGATLTLTPRAPLGVKMKCKLPIEP
ncbi:MAG TPA: hypothetical protein VHY22_15725 [Chthoniobacteraceae bacterium]|nr:hypothetical protein [Chthoniobacteraceae bacterium]